MADRKTDTWFIALDPSSTRTGFAMFDRSGQPTEIGFLSAPKQKLALDRILVMNRQLMEMIYNHTPDFCVIEVPQGKVHKRHGGGGTGLAVYGMAAGYLASTCHHCSSVRLVEDSWGGGESKTSRRHRLIRMFPEYAEQLLKNDSGGDAGDALDLGHWWIQRTRAAANVLTGAAG